MKEPRICQRCRHTERYAGPLDTDGFCGSCADDLRQDYEASRMADLWDADLEQRMYDAAEEAYYNAADKELAAETTWAGSLAEHEAAYNQEQARDV